jgi:hypothetical protein
VQGRERKVLSTQRAAQNFLFAFSWKDISLLTAILVSLNLVDVILSIYATTILGFIELNPFATDFPIWILTLKFGVCFIPLVCAYTLDKLGNENYLIFPFVFLAILIQIYAFIVGFNLSSIL